MKLAIVSDLHLGYERFRSDAYNQAKQALEMASEISDALLMPGDIFDARSPKPEALAEGINLFRTLVRRHWGARVTESDGGSIYTDLPIIAIPGTHERRANGVENPVSLLNLAGLLVDASEARIVIEKDGERVVVTGIGGISEERFGDYLKKADLRPVEGAFNVLMFHQSLRELLPFGNETISMNELPDGFDLYVNGHIHNRVEKAVHGKPFIIPGSTVLTQLKDSEQEEKGFYVYDTKARSYTFHKIKSRAFIVVKIGADGKEPGELRDFIKEKVDNVLSARSDVPIIKVELSGTLKSGFKSADADLSGIIEEYRGRALVEIAKAKLEDVNSDFAGLRDGIVENVPVKDLGMGIFLEKLKQSNYELPISPSLLFEMLSSENKEKSTKKILEELFK